MVNGLWLSLRTRKMFFFLCVCVDVWMLVYCYRSVRVSGDNSDELSVDISFFLSLFFFLRHQVTINCDNGVTQVDKKKHHLFHKSEWNVSLTVCDLLSQHDNGWTSGKPCCLYKLCLSTNLLMLKGSVAL